MGTLTDDDLLHLLGEAAGSFRVPEDGHEEVLADVAAEKAAVPVWRHRRVQLVAAAAVVAIGTVLVAPVLGSPDASRVEQLAGAGDGELRRLAGPMGEGAGQAGGTGSGELAYSTQSGQARGTAPVPASPGAVSAPAAPTADGARVVKTGAIALVVDDGQVTPVLTKVQSLATAAGGEVAVAKTAELGPTPSGSVTLRVPVDSFEEVVEQVRSLDAEVRSATTAGRDVTAEYADLEVQIRTLTAARERFLEILSGTRTIGDVLAVQQRVDDATGKIDRLEGQRRVLASQSERATLEVTVTEADDPAVLVDEPDDGLSKAFSDAWRGFTTGVEGLIRLSGRGVLLLLCLAVAYVVVRVGWRASRRRMV